jgi:copper chaperone CopZ
MNANSKSRLAHDEIEIQAKTVTLLIEGMTCGSCVSHVEKALRKVEGVQSVSVDLAKKTAELRVRSSVKTDLLVSTVEALGYGVKTAQGKVRPSGAVAGEAPSCCCGPG